MHSLRSTELSLPLTAFGEAHRPGSDPLKFPLNLCLSDPYCLPSLRAPYLSPPMSGSPSPQNRFDPLRGERRRQQSSSPTFVSTQPVSQSLPTLSEALVRDPVPEPLIHDPRPSHATSQPVHLATLTPLVEVSHLRPGLVTGPPLPPRATPLPPRSTRRAKAHVASACVNCKRKHLGCDAARPCRRCVVAGKEASCVDVTHKRRGRPPLKAEEGPLRSYEPGYVQSAASRPAPHGSSPLARPYGHRRNPSSRELRPSTELHHLSQVGLGPEYGRLRQGSGISIHPPTYIPPILSPPRSMPASTTVPVSAHGQRPVSSGSFQTTHHGQTPNFSPRSRPETYTRSYSDAPKPTFMFSGEGLRTFSSPQQSQPHHPLSASSYFSPVDSPHGPTTSQSAPVSSERRVYSLPETSHAGLKLPPILPSVTDPGPSPWSLYAARLHSGPIDRVPPPNDSMSRPTNPPIQLAPLPSGPAVRKLAEPSGPPLPPQPPLPRPEPQLQHSQEVQRQEPPLLYSTTQAFYNGAKRVAPKEENDRDAPRPSKRRKMTLGEMVND
ncbi:hypothetical protein AJ80_06262 [Polytolypa hystricis UAMH7299]|uniref:Zn(2)-C6 fungal-type domain-containing protein n=1 Tax=Polytolypa hystricis (strain UAMH7299) TaxID=1447883 RepID=A0A2B7XX76_POLH7|nr:hypothetical protein AJ80_06262 [Polytolypa hystricis UAMH7299]